MTKYFLIFPGLVIFSVILVVAALFWGKSNFAAVSSEANYKNFIITKGASASQIANNLERDGLIKSALAFRVYTQLTGISTAIFAGEYRLSPHMNLGEIVKSLTSGPLEVWVTIPEGLRREEILGKFIDGLGKSGTDQETFKSEFLASSKDDEGYLFPDTYLFPKEASGSAVIARMKATFDRKISDFEEEIGNSKLSLSQIVILASILERETKTDQERPVVAGVLLNRLNIGMSLQADATAQYAVANIRCQNVECDWWPRPITREDLEINSPYNTYQSPGLPPKPISNPGISSLRAAIKPESSEYYYYIHDAQGQIHYAKSLDEHNANVRNYLNK